MSISLAIVLIVLLDAALIGLLAFVMSRASRLTPHASKTVPTAVRVAVAEPTPSRPRSTRNGRLGAPASARS